MNYKIFFFLFFIFSCSQHYSKSENRKSYNASGFAYIFNEKDYEMKKIKKKLNNEYFQVAHKDLKVGTLIKLINPKTKEVSYLGETSTMHFKPSKSLVKK